MTPAPSPVAPAPSRWWAPAPDPELAPISARRAYLEVLLVFGAFFLAGVLAAGLLLAGRYHDPFTNASWSDYGPEAIDLIGQMGLAVAVVLLLCARRGVSTEALGLTLPRGADGRFAAGRATRIVAWGLFAIVLGGIINALLQSGHLPTTQPNAAELVFALTDSLQAGIVEELVVLAFVVVTLRQAGRPLWEVTVVALVLRGSYHIYYGPGVFGILVWAALFYWVYLRTRSLLILMACHIAWDSIGFLSQRWGAVAAIGALVAVGIWIAAPITWLVERNNPSGSLAWRPGQLYPGDPPPGQTWSGWPAAPAQSGWEAGSIPPPGYGAVSAQSAGYGAVPAQSAPPGWQPDPSGAHHWRWWDGGRWTEYVSGP